MYDSFNMGSRGLTFDGLDQTPIITNVVIETTDKNEAAYFQATNGTNQFRTTQSNLEFTANSTTPNFNFENSLGSTTNSTINAGTFNAQTLNLVKSSTSPVTILSTLAPDIVNSETVQYLIGKNQSSNAASFYLKYVYDLISETSRRFSIQAFGRNDSVSVYIPSITATSTEGTLVVNGGISTTSIYANNSITSTSSITGTSLVGTSLNVSSGAITGGAIVGTSLNVSSGSITGGTITGTTQTLTKSTPGRILYLNSSDTGATSTTTGLLLIEHKSTSITGDVYTMTEFFASNMPSTSSAEIRVGRNAATGASFNAFSAMFGYTYNTTASLRKGYIRLHNYANTLEFFQPSVVGTTASTGSVVVTGDLATSGVRATSLNLYETTSTANAVKLQAATSTAAYTLKLPTNLGTTNDYLQLGSSGQLQWSAGTGGGSGGSAAYIAALQRTGSQTLALNTNATVQFATSTYDVNTNLEYNTSGATNPYYFKNISGGTIYVQVTANIECVQTAAAFQQLDIRFATSTSVAPASATVMSSSRILTTQASSDTRLVASAIVKLLANECFFMQAANTSSATVALTNRVYAQVLGGSGLQSITLNSTSSFLTGSAQTTGLNPTINFGLAQTPTGSGTKLLTDVSPTIKNISLQSTINLQIVSIEAASGTSAYSFILPSTIGSAGNILSSTGANLEWADQGSFIGTSGSSLTSPLLTLDGTSTSNVTPNLLIRDYRSSTTQAPLSIQAPNLISGQEVCIRLGKANATNDSIKLSYSFLSTGSDTNNFNISLFNQTNSIEVYAPDKKALNASTLTVKGGAQATDLIITGKSEFGTTTRSVDVYATAAIAGKSSLSANPVLQINNYSDSATTATTISAYTPSLPLNQESAIRFGKSNYSLNSGVLGFTYDADGTSANYINLRLHSQTDSVKIYKDSITASSTTTATLVAKGGIGCTSLNTNSAIINSINITPTGGTVTDLTIWWGYAQGGSDPSVTLTYPSIPSQGGGLSGQIDNQEYSWQQIGKSYTFSLNLYVEITYTSAQLHLIFLRSNTHAPPEPFCTWYQLGIPTSNNDYQGTVVQGLGLYIPAMYL